MGKNDFDIVKTMDYNVQRLEEFQVKGVIG